jgi:hypothetical protein
MIAQFWRIVRGWMDAWQSRKVPRVALDAARRQQLRRTYLED